MKKIIEFFAVEHLFGSLLTYLILGLGLISLLQTPREVWPPVDFDLTTITTVYPGASPEVVEKLVINPIEDALREVDGLKEVFSTATESTGVVVVILDPDEKDPKLINEDIKTAIDNVSDFPEEVNDPVITERDTSKNPILQVSISGEVSQIKLRSYAKKISDELLKLNEVSSITKNGYDDIEYIIEADPRSLNQKNISLRDIYTSIQQQNISFPAGSITNAELNEVLIRTEGEYKNSDEILDTIIRSNDAGYSIRLKEVATVHEDLEETALSYRANGLASINLTVMKKHTADAIILSEKIHDKVDALKKRYPEIKISIINDLSRYVRNRVNVLRSNFLIGLILVIIVLAIFLPKRVTMVVAIGIPVALLATFIVTMKAGVSINLISMIGLILVLGMIVDDAIVVCENVWRYFEAGVDPLTAVVQGTREVVPPVIASVLTTTIAFAPFLNMTGIMGKFIFQIPVMVILALVFSLFEAFIIMPSHFHAWVSPGIDKMFKKQKNKKKSDFMNRLNSMYANYLEKMLNKRWWVCAGLVFLGTPIVALILFNSRFILFPPEGVESFFIRIEAPRESSQDYIEREIKKIEQIVNTLPKVEYVDQVSTLGLIQNSPGDPGTRRGAQYAQIQVNLTPERERDRTAQDIIDDLKEKIKKPDSLKSIKYSLAKGGPPQGSAVSINIIGDKFSEINELAATLQKSLSKIEGVKEIENSFINGKDEFQIRPKYAQAAALGVSVSDISFTAQAAFNGVIASQFRELDDEISIRVKLKDSQESIQQQLNHVKVGNRIGNLIPLSEVAEFEKKPSLNSVSHYQFKRLINVSADVDIEKITATQVVPKLIEDLQLKEDGMGTKSMLSYWFGILFLGDKPEVEKHLYHPDHPDLQILIGGENKNTAESMISLFTAFIYAVIGIFALLLVTFRRFLQPLLVIGVIPMGVTGSILALNIHGKPLSFMSMLGVVALAGVIVNNAIVLTDFVNKKRAEGIDKITSIIESATTRLRPIILTSITTVSGLLPTAYGWGGADPFIMPLALSFGWGLAIGALLTLLFFPVFIALLDDLSDFFERMKERFLPN